MDRLAKIQKQVAAMRKTEQGLASVRAKTAKLRAEQEAAYEAEQKPKRLFFAALFDAPPPAPKAKVKKPQLSKSAKRRLKIHLQFEALCDVEDSIVRRKRY